MEVVFYILNRVFSGLYMSFIEIILYLCVEVLKTTYLKQDRSTIALDVWIKGTI